jgi:hypothetical protein
MREFVLYGYINIIHSFLRMINVERGQKAQKKKIHHHKKRKTGFVCAERESRDDFHLRQRQRHGLLQEEQSPSHH